MSDNPFADPPPQPVEPVVVQAGQPAPGQTLPPVSPGGLTPALVFCLIFGILGLITTCLGGGVLLALPLFENMIEGVALPEEQKAFQRINLSSQSAAMLPTLILMGINLIVAPMLIFGSIGCFKRKESSRGFLRMALLGAIFYSVLKIVITVYAYFVTTDAARNAIEALKDDPIYDDVKTQFAAGEVMNIAGIVVGVVVAVALMAFYVWARMYLGKPEVEQHFTEVTGYKRNAGI